MFEAYKIGVTVAVTNMASAGLAKVARDFTSTSREAKRLQKEIDRLRKTTAADGSLSRQAAQQKAQQTAAAASARSMEAQKAALAAQGAALAAQGRQAIVDESNLSEREQSRLDRRRRGIEERYIKDKNALSERASRLGTRHQALQIAAANRVETRSIEDKKFRRRQANINEMEDAAAQAAAQERLNDDISESRRKRVLQDARSQTMLHNTETDRREAARRRSNLDAGRKDALDQVDEKEADLRERQEARAGKRKREALRLQAEAVRLQGQQQLLSARIEEANLRKDHASARALETEKERVRQAERLVQAEADIARTHERENMLLRRQRNLRRGLLAGGGMLGAGALAAYGLYKTIDPAKDILHEQKMMEIAGHGDKVDRVKRFYGEMIQDVPSAGLAETMGTFLQGIQIFGNANLAEKAMPMLIKTASVLQASTGKELNIEGMVTSLGKVVDMRGKSLRPEDFAKEVEMMSKAIVWSHGVITPETYQGVLKYARTAKMSLSPSLLYEYLPTLIMENMTKGGGGSAGRGGPGAPLATLYNVLGGSVARAQIPMLAKMGLVREEDLDEAGRINPEIGMKNADVGRANPVQWIRETLEPALEDYLENYGVLVRGVKTKFNVEDLKKTFEGNDKLGKLKLDLIGQLFGGKRLAASFVGSVVYGKEAMDRDVAMIRGAMGTNQAYARLIQGDPGLLERTASGLTKSAIGQAGMAFMPTYTWALGEFVLKMADLNTWMTKNPEKLKENIKWFAKLSATLVALGTVTLAGTIIQAGRTTIAIVALNRSLGVLAARAAAAAAATPAGPAAAGAAAGWSLKALWTGAGAILANNWSAITKGAKGGFIAGSPLPIGLIFDSLAEVDKAILEKKSIAKIDWGAAGAEVGRRRAALGPYSPLANETDRNQEINIFIDGQQVEATVTSRQISGLDQILSGNTFDPTMGDVSMPNFVEQR